jgi:hypothetical protein
MIQILDVGALTKVIGTDSAQPFVASVFSAQRAGPPQHSRFYTPSAMSRHCCSEGQTLPARRAQNRDVTQNNREAEMRRDRDGAQIGDAKSFLF